ncbi:Hypothetical_protein [Hexamita inflata]|uniref:Hypothetical_protein n=1 Tax=Hexamita inflata TaxID=28002 RepID=A0ABP1I731_9EUKA
MIYLFFVLVQQLNCNMAKTDSCETAYLKFVTCFNKPVSDDRKQIFCRSFTTLLSLVETCDTCDITLMMDQQTISGLIPDLDKKYLGNPRLSKQLLFSEQPVVDVIPNI